MVQNAPPPPWLDSKTNSDQIRESRGINPSLTLTSHFLQTITSRAIRWAIRAEVVRTESCSPPILAWPWCALGTEAVLKTRCWRQMAERKAVTFVSCLPGSPEAHYRLPERSKAIKKDCLVLWRCPPNHQLKLGRNVKCLYCNGLSETEAKEFSHDTAQFVACCCNHSEGKNCFTTRSQSQYSHRVIES